MIRKQFYITPEQQRKLHVLVKRWKCTEAEIVRQALDQLEGPDDSVEAILAAAGLLAPKRDDPDLPSPSEVKALEEEWRQRLRRRTGPLDLTSAVIEDRR